MAKQYTIEGVTDEADTCDCCGRQGLKRTVALRHVDTGVVEFFGTTCAAHILKRDVREVRKEAKAADDRKAELARAERRRKDEAEGVKWVAFLVERTGGGDIPTMIQKLGGFNEARRLYNETR